MSITSVLSCLPGSYQTNRKKYVLVSLGKSSKYCNAHPNVGITLVFVVVMVSHLTQVAFGKYMETVQ